MILLSVNSYDGSEHFATMPIPADLDMSEEDKNSKNNGSTLPPSMGGDWGSGSGSGRTKLFESPDDLDIYCDRENGINYIFHGPELNCTIDHLEYDHDTQRITVFTNDRQKLDLGVKIQWLVRPYIAKEQELYIIRTKNGETVDGVIVPLKIKDPEITKDSLKSRGNTEETSEGENLH